MFHNHITDEEGRVDVYRHIDPHTQAKDYCLKYHLTESQCSHLTLGMEEIYNIYMSLQELPRNVEFTPPSPVYFIGNIPLMVSPGDRLAQLTIMSYPSVEEQVESFCRQYDIMEGFCSILMKKAYDIYHDHHPIVSSPLRNNSLYSIERQFQDMNFNMTFPLRILINAHPCSGKSTFLLENARLYRGIKLVDIDDYTDFPFRRVQLFFNHWGFPYQCGQNFGETNEEIIRHHPTFQQYPNAHTLHVLVLIPRSPSSSCAFHRSNK